MKRTALFLVVLIVFGGCDYNAAPPSAGKQPNGSANQPDNTGVNARDRSDVAKTPIDQNENKADVGITADIRKQIVATKMSVNAQNVKIITQEGQVTLRGPVKNDDEKQRIEEIAVKVAGAGKVNNLLEVETER